MNTPSGLTAWADLDKTEKMFLLTDLLLTLRAKSLLPQPDPAICLLAPEESVEEVSLLWRHIVDTSIPTPHNTPLYFEVVARPSFTRPTLFFASDQELALLTQYFNQKVKESGVDTSVMIPVVPGIESLRAFYLCREIPSSTPPSRTTICNPNDPITQT